MTSGVSHRLGIVFVKKIEYNTDITKFTVRIYAI